MWVCWREGRQRNNMAPHSTRQPELPTPHYSLEPALSPPALTREWEQHHRVLPMALCSGKSVTRGGERTNEQVKDFTSPLEANPGCTRASGCT